ncbi:MAG: WhiB family transcriptional regulator [Buchananella hordeovulneris]|nr:WhiB family transcriptional regulator [Buchananella hordeovulneris]
MSTLLATAPPAVRSGSSPFGAAHLELLAELFVERDLEGAACAGQPSIFDAGERGGMPLEQARALCEACPVRAACARLGDGPDGRFGYWAGTSASARVEKRRRRPGPAVLVDEYARLVAQASARSGLGGCTSWHLRAAASWVTPVAAGRYLSILSRTGRVACGERWTGPDGHSYRVYRPTATLLPTSATASASMPRPAPLIEEIAALVARLAPKTGIRAVTSWHIQRAKPRLPIPAITRTLADLCRAGRVESREDRWRAPNGRYYLAYAPTDCLDADMEAIK